MPTCSKCKKEYACVCTHCGHDPAGPVGQVVAPCEPKCSATVYVQESQRSGGVAEIMTKLDGAEKKTDGHGFRTVKDLKPGAHAAAISLAGMEDRYALAPGNTAGPVSKTIPAGDTGIYTFVVDPLTSLKVQVKRRHDANGVKDAKVRIQPTRAGNTVADAEGTTPIGGDHTFKRLRSDTYRLGAELAAPQQDKFVLEKGDLHHPLDMTKNPDEVTFWVRLVVHLRLKYKDPDDKVRPFPKGFAFTVAYNDGSTQEIKVVDDKGYASFEVAEAGKTDFTLKFNSGKARYLVHTKDRDIAELLENPTDDQLRSLTLENRKLFALPQRWTLAESAWATSGITVPQDGKIAFPADGLGTQAAPAELTLTPALMHVRLEFFDRKHVDSNHGGRRVSIPPVLLKGARISDASGVPQNPTAGTHDAISNWVLDIGSDDACQCLPWIITRKADGTDLPKLDRRLLLEFGWPDAFVHSTGPAASERKIEVLPATDARRKPGRDRNRWYDLPRQWKSTCYYTRLPDQTKNKFLDEFAAADDADLEGAWTKAGRLAFSLDDIVLVDGAGAQSVQDRDAGDVSVALSEYSRLTLLYLDASDKYKVKVYKPRPAAGPRPAAAYWSESEFQREAGASAVRRNVIVEPSPHTRAIVFCSDFHDVYDKRTGPADFSRKEILGARAAKIEDGDVSSGRTVFDQDAHVDAGYVHLKRRFHLRYLHYGATDGTTVYGALVTYWSCRLAAVAAEGGTNADVTLYRAGGMERAMRRWNEKDYYFEEQDDKKDVVVKHFCLFEAKDVETGPGAAQVRGGSAICAVSVRDDDGGSSASVDGLTMKMRRSGAKDEGQHWGDNTATLAVVPQYDSGNASPKSAFAHELGHAAIGLFDDYITGKLGRSRAGIPNFTDKDELLDRDGQRVFGMPYAIDASPIMLDNRAVRLRYFWGRARWLNDQSGASLARFLSGKKFRAAYEPAGAAKLRFWRPNQPAYSSIYKPNFSARPHRLANEGRCDLHLFHLGEDEFSVSRNGGPYSGILAVCIKFSARFTVRPISGRRHYKAGDLASKAGSTYRCIADHQAGIMEGTGTPDAAKWELVDATKIAQQQVRHLEDLHARIVAMTQERFRLQGSGTFGTTYLRIFPQWEIKDPPAAATAGTHFELEVVFGGRDFAATGNGIRAETGCDPSSIVRYVFGKIGSNPSRWAADGGATGPMTKDDFAAIKTWVDAQAGARFNVGDI